MDKHNFSEELIDRLISIALIAIGNILVVVGENLVEKGREKMNSAGGENKDSANVAEI